MSSLAKIFQQNGIKHNSLSFDLSLNASETNFTKTLREEVGTEYGGECLIKKER